MTSPTKAPSPPEDETPMMKQYQGVKRDHPDSILFFRMGDFYEMFNEDAKAASKILQIALTSRSKNKAQGIPMCGIPHHSAKGYIAKLIQAGQTVAICEQVEDPRQAKGIVRREVVRVVTPGTVLDDALLDPQSDHFLVSLFFGEDGFGLAALDITTGLFKTTEFSEKGGESLLRDELEKMEAREILVPQSLLDSNGTHAHWLKSHCDYLRGLEDWTYSHSQSYRCLVEHFKTASLEGFGCETWKKAVRASGALLQYLNETQKSSLDHVTALTAFNVGKHMLLDPATLKNLELIKSSEGGRKGSLLDLLDVSQTPLGSRKIREWIVKPLIEKPPIDERLGLVDEFVAQPILRSDFREQFKSIFDLERLLGRLAMNAGSPRDLHALKTSLAVLPVIRRLLDGIPQDRVGPYAQDWDDLESVYKMIDETIVDDPPLNFKNGCLIKPGRDEELDRLKTVSRDGKTWIANHEIKEKERTGIPTLKVGYNKIYGYYIEVTKKQLERVPPEYIRKQSLVNCERYISPELKDYENEIAGAEEKIIELENRIFQKFRSEVAAEGARIQHMARILGELDALLAFAEIAHRKNYCRPRIREGGEIKLVDARHPLIEHLNPSLQFIPNDTSLDCDENQIMIITGPNMAGKSTFLRQTALISLMAQIGSFVPCEAAEVGLVDRIFSRVGAQDHLMKGQSTFMVEMNETANILNNATSKSLIVLDEIGRGTSTFDGVSIAWSIVEYLHGAHKIGAKTLFATHYHELTELALTLPGVKNYSVQVKEWNDEIIFLRKIIPGGADKSYGIQVARLAGLPETVLARAREILYNLETGELDENGSPKIGRPQKAPENSGPKQILLFQEPASPILQKLKEIHPDELTPRQALDFLYEIRQLIDSK